MAQVEVLERARFELEHRGERAGAVRGDVVVGEVYCRVMTLRRATLRKAGLQCEGSGRGADATFAGKRH